MECKEGFKEIKGKCVEIKKKIQGSLKREIATKTVQGLSPQQYGGIFLIILAFLVPFFLKTTECSWYNLFCHAKNVSIGGTSQLLIFGLIGIGIYMIAVGGITRR